MLCKIKHALNFRKVSTTDTNDYGYNRRISIPDFRPNRKVDNLYLHKVVNSSGRVGVPRTLEGNRLPRTKMDLGKQAEVVETCAEERAVGEFETASKDEGKELNNPEGAGDEEELDTMVASLRLDQAELDTNCKEEEEISSEKEGDNTFIEGDSKPVNQASIPVSRFSSAHPCPLIIKPAELAGVDIDPLKTSTSKEELIGVMAALKFKINALTTELSRSEALAKRLRAVNAAFDEVAKRSERIQLIVQMFKEEPEELTAEYKVYIENELVDIDVVDLALFDEYVKIKVEWEMAMKGLL